MTDQDIDNAWRSQNYTADYDTFRMAVGRAIESASVAPLLERIAALEAESTRLEGMVYSPGLWRCAKCKFTLVQRNLNAHSGTVTARDQPGDKCPNCDVTLWRVTERENALENYEAAESLQIRLNALEAKLAQRVPDGWPTNEMIEAGRKAADSHGPLLGNGQSLWHIFRDMLSAAPAAPEQQAPNARQAEAQEPVYQYQRADGSWIDQTKVSHDYNVRHGQATVRVLFTRPQPAQLQALSDAQREVIAFLDGTGPLDGAWYGDKHPTEQGAFWWRKRLWSAFEPAHAAIARTKEQP